MEVGTEMVNLSRRKRWFASGQKKILQTLKTTLVKDVLKLHQWLLKIQDMILEELCAQWVPHLTKNV